MVNQHKTVHVSARGITVFFTDSGKHHFISFEQTRSMLDHIQLYGNKHEGQSFQQNFETDQFTSYQNTLYRDALFGVQHYSSDELRSVSLKDKIRIQNMYRDAQNVLNKWKQQLTIRKTDAFLVKMFPKSAIVKEMIGKTKGYTNSRTMNTLTFRDLGISKQQIAQKLVDARVLPHTFFTAKAA